MGYVNFENLTRHTPLRLVIDEQTAKETPFLALISMLRRAFPFRHLILYISLNLFEYDIQLSKRVFYRFGGFFLDKHTRISCMLFSENVYTIYEKIIIRRELSMKVRDVMTSAVDWVTPDTSVVEVAKLMKKDDVGSIPICKGNKLIGVITDRDIVLKVVAAGGNINNMSAKDIMSTNIISVSTDQDVHEAANLMSINQIRRLPVLENDQLVGIVAIGDLAIEKIYINEAGDALSDISQGAHH